MRLKLLITVAFLVLTGTLKADTITGTVTGVITQGPGLNTTDVFGLFGPAGANLAGNSVLIKYSYNTADFQNAPTSCGTNCTTYSDSANSPAEFISISMNGQTQSYSPSLMSGIEIQNATVSDPSNSFVEVIDGTAGKPGDLFALDSANNIAFGQPTTAVVNGSDDVIALFNSNGSYEGFEFTPSTPSPAPEPSSILLVGTGLLGMAGIVKRRIGKRTASVSASSDEPDGGM